LKKIFICHYVRHGPFTQDTDPAWGHFEALQHFFRRFVHTKSRFLFAGQFYIRFYRVLVNLAVVPLVHEISRARDLNANKRLLSSAIPEDSLLAPSGRRLWLPLLSSSN
jgi:hypothetical protein